MIYINYFLVFFLVDIFWYFTETKIGIFVLLLNEFFFRSGFVVILYGDNVFIFFLFIRYYMKRFV